ncbi:carboxyl transferase [Halioglobus sp. HI00S01]|uniref:acyl-CoA carboxylase subunit beta n=1 Tax=Halioglobus sp. HI00S01 TaxID=1822214 RepID=UPI0007C3870F|nr:carboxyl transferase domain-containing protein [Halioglobus sp. HI00S01]KZX53479.1 carboxyl transferase [Halioglobus sp. HI00S01]
MSSNREQWQSLLQDLNQRQARAEAMGGEERVARQHGRGRLTARERVARFLDPDSFNEIGALAGDNHPNGEPPLAGDGVVGGTGAVHGQTVVVLAEDFTVKGGSIGHANAAKRARLVTLAAQQSLPLVLMLEGAGERASNGFERYPNTPNDLQLVADLKGKVPVVSMIMGPSAGHGALTGMFADFIIMLEDAALFTAGPPLVAASLGIECSPQELGSAQMHATQSGVVHNVAATEDEAIDQARYFLGLVAGAITTAPQAQPGAEKCATDALLDIIPPDGQRAYDVRRVIDAVADRETVFELQSGYGSSLVVALARIGGIPTTVIANQPAALAGAITTQAAEKAAHFIEVADHFGLPLVFMLDNPGAMPGPQSERDGILKAAGKMFAAQRRYRGQKIVVTLRKGFGFGSSAMGMNPWDGQAINLALPSVSLGGVPAIGGDAAAKATADESARMQDIQSGAWVPADSMAFDKIVSPVALRDEIIDVLHRHPYSAD